MESSCGYFMDVYPLVMTNIAMENSPFIDGLPIKTSIYKRFSMVMLNNQMFIIKHVFFLDSNQHHQQRCGLSN